MIRCVQYDRDYIEKYYNFLTIIKWIFYAFTYFIATTSAFALTTREIASYGSIYSIITFIVINKIAIYKNATQIKIQNFNSCVKLINESYLYKVYDNFNDLIFIFFRLSHHIISYNVTHRILYKIDLYELFLFNMIPLSYGYLLYHEYKHEKLFENITMRFIVTLGVQLLALSILNVIEIDSLSYHKFFELIFLNFMFNICGGLVCSIFIFKNRKWQNFRNFFLYVFLTLSMYEKVSTLFKINA